MDMSKTFDTHQMEVIHLGEGRHLVLAPPGCGKTEILKERISHLQSQGIPPEDMICLTFTNRAARAMRERLQEDGTEGLDGLFVGNLHRFCSSFLYDNRIISLDTGIIDENDLKDIMDDFGLKKLNTRASKEFEEVTAEDISNLSAILFQKANGHPAGLLLPCRPIPRWATAEADSMARRYSSYKEEHNIIDFNDLLVLSYTAMMDPSYREKYSMTSYHWIQVDEVQDLSPLQMALVDKLTAPEGFSVLYLGDERQAIYSFMGAKVESLRNLETKCGGHVLHLFTNYRSPSYMLDLLNLYAESELGIPPSLLPTSSIQAEAAPGDLSINCYGEYDKMTTGIARAVKTLRNLDPEGSVGILVRTNRIAEDISAILSISGLEHFKLSGEDVFKGKSYKALLAHFGVCYKETNFLEWARLLWSVGAVKSYKDGRTACAELRSKAMTPLDLVAVRHGEDTLLGKFARIYSEGELVIFDTETTGLDVFNDDIIQIAAIKVRGGEIVPGSEFNLLLRTERPIPQTLGSEVNPMVQLYAEGPLTEREEGLRQFMEYVGEDPLLGHNSDFDERILKNNMGRFPALKREYHLEGREVLDSLRLIRLVEPHLKVYKLRSLLEALGLEGVNSHRADDDILATKSLVDYIYGKASSLVPLQGELRQNYQAMETARAIEENYLPLYRRTREALLSDRAISEGGTSMLDEMIHTYSYMLSQEFIEKIPRFEYICSFLGNSVFTNPATEDHMLTEVERHLGQLRTYSNADLCDSGVIKEKIYLMTVHKAKGLEFDRVIMFDCTDGTYPWFSSKTDQQRDEDKRVFYVGLSRARRGLFLMYTVRRTYYAKRISPFISPIRHLFKEYNR